MTDQPLVLIPAPPGTPHLTGTFAFACGSCHATIGDGKVITHADDCGFIAGIIDRAAEKIAARASDEIAEWEWANPIPVEYLIKGGTLHCADHGDLFSVGLMELWEFALDAKKHHQEQHGGES
jgi:hypothetical protein